jgi:hypothetical protein
MVFYRPKTRGLKKPWFFPSLVFKQTKLHSSDATVVGKNIYEGGLSCMIGAGSMTGS